MYSWVSSFSKLSTWDLAWLVANVLAAASMLVSPLSAYALSALWALASVELTNWVMAVSSTHCRPVQYHSGVGVVVSLRLTCIQSLALLALLGTVYRPDT